MAACRDVNRGRPDAAPSHLLRLGPHWDLLTGVPRSDMWQHLRPDALETVLRDLCRHHDLVVVDCGFGVEDGFAQPSRDQVTRRVLDLADEVMAVGRVDPVGLARLVRAVDDAGPWARPPRLVLNGFRSSLGWTEREVAQTVRELTGHTPWAFLPQDGPGHDLALMTGRPLREVAPSSGYVSRVERLASDLAAQPNR
jgi:Flp pilus assembly CpaE family ATPase